MDDVGGQSEETTPTRPTAVDLFAGAGGASLGLGWAGFEVVGAVDNDDSALQTHHENLPTEPTLHDLTEIDVSVLPERAQTPAYIHGSPPCKGFSQANNNRSAEDNRNSLVFDFVEWVRELTPAVATMENVTGMLNISPGFMNRVTEGFRNAGYEARYKTLNAANYGVPQTRKRVITVAVRKDVEFPSRWFPQPTHAESATTTLNGQRLKKWMSVEEAINDLGEVGGHRPQAESANETTNAIWRPPDAPAHTVKGQGSHAIAVLPNDDLESGLKENDEIDVPTNADGGTPEDSRELPSDASAPSPVNHQKTDHDPEQMVKLADIPHGGRGQSMAYCRLDPEEPARTIQAGGSIGGITAPIHYRTVEVDHLNHDPREATENNAMDWEDDEPAPTICDGRLSDRHRKARYGSGVSMWKGARRLTARECARLQSFPDWFGFVGTKVEQYEQIGNAVPPLLQYHLSDHLRRTVLSSTPADGT